MESYQIRSLQKSILFFVFFSFCICIASEAQSLLLDRVTIIDFNDDGEMLWESDCQIKIKDGLIDSVVYDPLQFITDKSLKNINLDQRVIISGLIDAHVHLTLKDSNTEIKDCSIIQNNLEKYLNAGITTIIDLGIAPDIENCIVKKSIYPNVISVGKLYYQRRKYSKACLSSYVSCPKDSLEASNSVALSYKKGKRIIKIWGMDPSSNLREALIKKARSLNMVVVEDRKELHTRKEIFNNPQILKPDLFAHSPPKRLHIYSTPKAKNDEDQYYEVIDSMSKYKVGLITTLVLNKNKKELLGGLKVLDLAKRSDLLVGLGTDSGFISPHGNLLHQEYDLLAKEFGWSYALKAATINSAKLFKINNIYGNIRPNKNADLLVLHSSFPKDSGSFKDLCMIIKSGTIIYKSARCGHN